MAISSSLSITALASAFTGEHGLETRLPLSRQNQHELNPQMKESIGCGQNARNGEREQRKGCEQRKWRTLKFLCRKQHFTSNPFDKAKENNGEQLGMG